MFYASQRNEILREACYDDRVLGELLSAQFDAQRGKDAARQQAQIPAASVDTCCASSCCSHGLHVENVLYAGYYLQLVSVEFPAQGSIHRVILR